jgi:hypothetical protein
MSIGHICWCRGCQSEQPCVVYGVPERPDTVTITISREDAEAFGRCDPVTGPRTRIANACNAALAALEGEK